MVTVEETAKGWAVLLSIRAVHAANIYAGTKTVELRKSVPRRRCRENSAKYPFRVYLYESKSAGGLGAITGYFECSSYVGTRGIYLEEISRRAQVSMEYLTDYGKGGWVYGWEGKNPCRFPAPLPISDLGFQRPPQSWCYLDAKACEILEVAAHGSSKS